MIDCIRDAAAALMLIRESLKLLRDRTLDRRWVEFSIGEV